MIPNYEIDKFGVIHQIERKPFVYDKEYSEIRYCSPEMKILTKHMSYLRMGYLLGTIGTRPETLLDVGYGNGAFLELAQYTGIKTYGYDIVPPYYLPAESTQVDSITDQEYDAITFFDSLEHFPSLEIMRDIKCKYVMISVPWCHYLSDEWFQNWKHLRPDEHLHHFSSASLILFMRDCGFKYLNFSNVEDAIRQPADNQPNILTGVFKHANH